MKPKGDSKKPKKATNGPIRSTQEDRLGIWPANGIINSYNRRAQQIPPKIKTRKILPTYLFSHDPLDSPFSLCHRPHLWKFFERGDSPHSRTEKRNVVGTLEVSKMRPCLGNFRVGASVKLPLAGWPLPTLRTKHRLALSRVGTFN